MLHKVFYGKLNCRIAVNHKNARVERDVGISVEPLALFIQFWLTITPPLPDPAAKAGAGASRRALRRLRRGAEPAAQRRPKAAAGNTR